MEHFKGIGKIKYEGAQSNNPLSFKYYNPNEVIDGKTMKEHLRFAVAYWHTFQASGIDSFGVGTAIRPWDNISDKCHLQKQRWEANFEFCEKLQVPFFCFQTGYSTRS